MSKQLIVDPNGVQPGAEGYVDTYQVEAPPGPGVTDPPRKPGDTGNVDSVPYHRFKEVNDGLVKTTTDFATYKKSTEEKYKDHDTLVKYKADREAELAEERKTVGKQFLNGFKDIKDHVDFKNATIGFKLPDPDKDGKYDVTGMDPEDAYYNQKKLEEYKKLGLFKDGEGGHNEPKSGEGHGGYKTRKELSEAYNKGEISDKTYQELYNKFDKT